MVKVIFIVSVLTVFSVGLKAQNSEKKSNTPIENVSGDTFRLGQMDGSVLTLAGVGTLPLEYTETIDGYTVVLNKEGIYEYAKQTRNGGLDPSGKKANNPNKRDAKEIKYVSKLTRHLRYQGAKLEEIQTRYTKLNRTLKKEKK